MFPTWPKADMCTAFIHPPQQLLPVFATTANDCQDNKEQSDYSTLSPPWALPGVAASPGAPAATKTAQ